MCSLVMNLKAEYLFEIHIGQNCGINWGQGVYLATEEEDQIHAEFQVGQMYILGCFVALID